jgi:hypothetical protein
MVDQERPEPLRRRDQRGHIVQCRDRRRARPVDQRCPFADQIARGPQPSDNLLTVDDPGEVKAEFRNPTIYLGYGVQWCA